MVAWYHRTISGYIRASPGDEGGDYIGGAWRSSDTLAMGAVGYQNCGLGDGARLTMWS
jgi:hypothetical protein